MKDLDVKFAKFVGHLGKRQNWHKYDILVNCFSFFAHRNSCFAGSEYEVGDGVFDVRVCQYDTPIGKMMQCTIFLEKSITNEKADFPEY